MILSDALAVSVSLEHKVAQNKPDTKWTIAEYICYWSNGIDTFQS